MKNKKQGKYDLLVLEACLVEDDTSAWIVDSGATNHICSSLQTLSSVGHSALKACIVLFLGNK